MAKASDAFRTIGEVSDELDVPKHVLRFWEGKFPQLKPMKRGGGRRFYRPEDVSLLRGIHHLLHAAGYTIKGVQRILREDGIDAVKNAANGDSVAPAPEIEAVATTTATPSGKGKPLRGATDVKLTPALRTHLTDLVRELEACLALARGTTGAAAERPARRDKAVKTKRS